MSAWNFDMSKAPRDGTPICLGWSENGKVQEYYYPMFWDPEAENHLVQEDKGIWVMLNDGAILLTWSESNPDGAPDVWCLIPPETKIH